MGLLDKTNPTATRESVIRHAVIGGVGGVIFLAIVCTWQPPLREFWPIFLPFFMMAGAALGALLEWRLADGIEIYFVVKEVEDEFDIEVPESEWMQIYTVGQLFDVTLNRVRASTANLTCIDSNLEDDVWRRLKNLLVYQLRLRPEQVVKSARFYENLGI